MIEITSTAILTTRIDGIHTTIGRIVAVEFITIVWQLSPYRAEKLLVQLAFADWANLEGEFHPTYDEIAEKARVTKPGAIGIVQSMIEEGEVVLLKRGRGRGSRNCYQFAEKYRIAVRELSERWAQKRAKKVKQHDLLKVSRDDLLQKKKVNEGDPFKTKKVIQDDHSKVKEDDLLEPEKVNEDGEKGKPGMTHIRNNRHEPLKGKPLIPGAHAPADNLTQQQCYSLFCEMRQISGGYEAPYQDKKADFVQLADLLKKCAKNKWPLTRDRFEHAARNYFLTPRASHTLADLAVNFSEFYKNPHNEFGRPARTGAGKENLAGFSPAAQQTIAAGERILAELRSKGVEFDDD